MEGPIYSGTDNLMVLASDEEEWLVVNEDERHTCVEMKHDIITRDMSKYGNSVKEFEKSLPPARESEKIRNLTVERPAQTSKEAQAPEFQGASVTVAQEAEASDMNEMGTCSVPMTYVARRWKRSGHVIGAQESNVWECILKVELRHSSLFGMYIFEAFSK
jgi:hypothetical protein